MLRSFLSIIGAWFLSILFWCCAMFALYLLGSQIAPEQFPMPPDPNNTPSNPWLAVTLLIDALAALLAGFLVVRFSKQQSKAPLIILTLLFTAGCIATAFGEAEKLPAWLSWSRVVIAPLCLLVGGAGRLEREGQHSRLDSVIDLNAAVG